MKTLTLEHLAPYLPYGLKVKNGFFKKHNQYTLTSLTFDSTLHNPTLKLILRPLSDLTKEIEVNGEKFVPIEWFNNINSNIDFELQLESLSHDIRFLNMTYYGIIEKLLSWHFDIFNLIEQDLAIDINTLKI